MVGTSQEDFRASGNRSSDGNKTCVRGPGVRTGIRCCEYSSAAGLSASISVMGCRRLRLSRFFSLPSNRLSTWSPSLQLSQGFILLRLSLCGHGMRFNDKSLIQWPVRSCLGTLRDYKPITASNARSKRNACVDVESRDHYLNFGSSCKSGKPLVCCWFYLT